MLTSQKRLFGGKKIEKIQAEKPISFVISLLKRSVSPCFKI
jgi:hypothetical protein